MKLRSFCLAGISISLLFASCGNDQTPIYNSDAFSIYPDRVVQGEFEAIALSANEISSNYRSVEEGRYSPDIQFKFSINSRDNEMPSGKDHMVTLRPENGKVITEVVFGKQLIDTHPVTTDENLPENTEWTIRLDLRSVLSDLKTTGQHTLFNGEILNRESLKAIYIAGSAAPLSWDFSNLYNHSDLEMKDTDGDGIYEIKLVMNREANRKSGPEKWTLSKDLSALPHYTSDYPISDAIYNLSLEEMLLDIEADSTFRTGKEWSGVWTRDISYSIILSMAHLQSDVARNSLVRKVKNNRIVQDTGTGGAYPVSTDRIVWAIAAWEVYKFTGDREWLEYSYQVIKNSIEDDLNNALNPETGLMKGESSFLDWREQTYPTWMQPADIYQSENLGTNAVHYQANKVLAEMAQLVGHQPVAERHSAIAERIKNGIKNYLWMEDKGLHGQYRYGRNFLSLSPRSETLGEALCILFGISDSVNSRRIAQQMPITPFGISCIYPQISGQPPYHNNGIWPFVQSYWAWASAKAGNESGVMEQLAAIYRPAALFLTNKENFVAQTGDFAGTQINSSEMLWSLSGNIALVHKILFGISFETDKIVFAPFVPEALQGKRSLTNLKYRQAILNIEMEGFGNKISSFEIDGKPSKPEFASTLTGEHSIRIVLAGNRDTDKKINMVANSYSPEIPLAELKNGTLNWPEVENADGYRILRNGKELHQTQGNSYQITSGYFSEYQIIAIDKKGVESFTSEPIIFADKPLTVQFEHHSTAAGYDYTGFRGDGFTDVSTTRNKRIDIPLTLTRSGKYYLTIRYANGNGPVNTNSRCAIRSLYVDNTFRGTLVFPQRGKEEWSNWGYSNFLPLQLKEGQQVLSVVYEQSNKNMDGEINQAMLDELILYYGEPAGKI